MTNIIDSNGINIDSLEDLVTNYSNELRNIYGSDIVLDPNSPDGLLVQFLAQVTRDASEFAVKLFNSYSLNTATGSLLDQRLAWQGITRKSATYTYVNVNITNTNAVNLIGLDGSTEPPTDVYTVQDNAGNTFYLASSTSLQANSTTSCSFRASDSGAVLVGANTINSAVTYNRYITTVNNPSAQSVTGEDAETDTELKWRTQFEYFRASQGFNDSMQASLLEYSDIHDAFVIDNPTNTTDAHGIPAWSVWVIVDCTNTTQTQEEIGDCFGNQITVGTPSYALNDASKVSIQRTNSQGTITTYNYNIVALENIYIYIDFVTQTSGYVVSETDLKNYLASTLSASFKIHGICNANDVTNACIDFDANIIVGLCKLTRTAPSDPSDPTQYSSTTYVEPSEYNKKFTLTASNIYLHTN